VKNSAGIFFFSLLVMAFVVAVALARVPEPGSKEDPIVTKSYVDWKSVWREVSVDSGGFLKLSPGVEFTLIEPIDHPVQLREQDMSQSRIADLTAGELLLKAQLVPFRHYLILPPEDVRLTFDEKAKIFIRGLKP